MSFDNTCCGTTCDAVANAKYVTKLVGFVKEVDMILQHNYYPEDIGYELLELWERNEAFLIKTAQQNNRTTAPMEQADAVKY